MSDQLRELSALRCRVVAHPLGPGPAPGQVLRRAAGSDGLVCLLGSWAGGGAVLAAEPLLVLADGADPVAALGVQPRIESGAELAGVVGGGWFGWLSYDGPSRLAFYDHLLRYDGAAGWSFEALWSAERDALLQVRREELAELLEGPDAVRPWRAGQFSGPSLPDHLRAVERAVELVRAGELYQVNVCTRFGAPFAGSAQDLFADAAGALQPGFAAYVEAGDRAVASLSPELFLRRRGRGVVTSPIKGIWPRPDGDDVTSAQTLRSSAKDAAENVMIVDLMRNDLGRVCETGSVRAASLLDVEPHPGVWHLVSTVSGRLRDEVGDEELLRATFPPGSVTGAPKLRAIEAIGALESGPRGEYTGAIGFASPSWGLEFSVAIRTFQISGGRVELGVGGGVTADSVPMLEWSECLHKAAPLLGALGRSHAFPPGASATSAQLVGGVFETILVRDGVPLRLADHLARLDRSCHELYGFGVPADTSARVHAAMQKWDRLTVRVVVTPARRVNVMCTPAPAPRLASVGRIVRGRTGLWRHKWAVRNYLDAAEATATAAATEAGDAGDTVPLFVADDGTVLETSRGNVFLLGADGTLVTPPLRDDLLPGVTRRAILDLARDTGRGTELRPFTVEELAHTTAFWTSSLSGAVAIHAVDGTALPRRDDEIAALAALLLDPHRR